MADAPAAAGGSAHGTAEDTLARAACAAWAVKALAGWDESEPMTFLLTHIEDDAPTADTSGTPARTVGWLSVHTRRDTHGWTVDVDWPRRRGWPTLFEALPIDSRHRHAYALLADVDRTCIYNDACGHLHGDLMLTRVHACLESLARQHGARFVQVGGEEFVMRVDTTDAEARRFAEELRHRIEALHIPLSHPEVRTPGMVTVSIGVAPTTAGVLRKERLEAAVDAAKRAGRNRVWADG